MDNLDLIGWLFCWFDEEDGVVLLVVKCCGKIFKVYVEIDVKDLEVMWEQFMMRIVVCVDLLGLE